jgi:hypothetical protein
VTWLTKVYKKKIKFRPILSFKECKMYKHMDKVRSVVLEKMDPYYSFGGLNSQQSTSCEPSTSSFLGRNEYPSTLEGNLHA